MSAVDKIEEKVAARKLEEAKLSVEREAALELIQLTAKGEEPCSLAKDPGHPGNNWVTEAGGLPPYICNVAKHIDAGSTSAKIAEAVSTIKKWIADPKTTAQTKAKATAAIASWEAKRGAAHVHATVKAAHDAAK